MDIAIIGGGISGCCTYLYLQKLFPRESTTTIKSITIYEAYDTNKDTTADDRGFGPTHSSTLIVGGGLGVAANGLNVIKRLDENLLRAITRGGYAVSNMDMRSKGGTLLARMQPAGKPDLNGQQNMNMVMCSRHALWRSFRVQVPDSVIVNKRVSRVIANADSKNVIEFADGSPSVEADLVIGADGLKGITKRAIYADDKEDLYPAHYEGLCGVGGFIPYDLVKDHIETGSANFVFGGNGFFGYFISDSAEDAPNRDSPHHISVPGTSVGWWSTYAVDECPDIKNFDKESVVQALKDRFKNWQDPVIQKILPVMEIKSIYPTWIVPPLPRWERDGVVLLGDAAHALPPTSGQGCSQALEDVEAFTRLLAKHLDNQADGVNYKEIINAAAKNYMELRKPRVTKILEQAQRMQDKKRDKSRIEEYIMYGFMWLLGCFPNFLVKPMRKLIAYDVPTEVNKIYSRQ